MATFQGFTLNNPQTALGNQLGQAFAQQDRLRIGQAIASGRGVESVLGQLLSPQGQQFALQHLQQQQQNQQMNPLQQAQIAQMQAQTGQIGQLTPLQQQQILESQARTGQIGQTSPLDQARIDQINAQNAILEGVGGGVPGAGGVPGSVAPGQRVAGVTMDESGGVSVRTERIPAYAETQVAKEGDDSGYLPGTIYRTDPETGEVNIKYDPRSGQMTPKEKKVMAQSDRKSFNSLPEVRRVEKTIRAGEAMKSALDLSTTPNSKTRGASDQALATLFQKLLDPESVVRESEFARTERTIALFNRFKAIGPKAFQGGLKLTDADRESLYIVARRVIEADKRAYNRAFDNQAEVNKAAGLAPKLVFGRRKRYDVPNAPGEEVQGTPTGPTRAGMLAVPQEAPAPAPEAIPFRADDVIEGDIATNPNQPGVIYEAKFDSEGNLQWQKQQ